MLNNVGGVTIFFLVLNKAEAIPISLAEEEMYLHIEYLLSLPFKRVTHIEEMQTEPNQEFD